VRKGPDTNSKFTCELCSKKAGMVIKEYGTGKWICYDCHFRREASKGTRETLITGDNKDV
jgi:ribosomal protein L37AE/L43A